MTSDQQIKFDRSLLGVEHPVGTFAVTREMMLAFSRATGETSLAYVGDCSGSGEIVAPPTFCNIFASNATRPDIKLEFGDIGLFAGQSIEPRAPVAPGDTLTATTKLKDVYAKTGRSGMMVFAVWQTSFANQKGETVALVEESYVRRNRRGDV